MIKNIFFILCILILISCKKSEIHPSSYYDCNLNFIDSSLNNPNHHAYQSHLNNITSQGIVGINMSIYKPQTGIWLGASGKSDLYNHIDLQVCNQSRVGSTVKMFTATIILKLAEEGKLNLDDPVSNYLTADYINKIENAEIATIRQLLQHSSGIYNYIQNLEFQTASLNNLIKEWKADDLMKYAYHKKAYFKPGEDVIYSNTNYILLGLLIEQIEGKPLYQVFDEKIIHPLQLNNTQFAGKNPVPNGIVKGYVDFYSNFNVIESTYYSGWDYYTADGGLISNPYDMNVFFRALMNGQVINSNSLNQMLSWKTPKTKDDTYFPIEYGLGIFKIETSKGVAYIHSGDAIGYYASMIYFPSDQTTIVYACNSNYGKLDEFISSKNAVDQIIHLVK